MNIKKTALILHYSRHKVKAEAALSFSFIYLYPFLNTVMATNIFYKPEHNYNIKLWLLLTRHLLGYSDTT